MKRKTVFAILVAFASAAFAVPHGGWMKYSGKPVMGNAELGTCFDVNVVTNGAAKFNMYFSWRPMKAVALARSEDGIAWSKPEICLESDETSGWEDDVNRSCTIFWNGEYHMWYTGQARGYSKIGYAKSKDGVHFTRVCREPVLIPERPHEGFSVMNPYVIRDEVRGVFRMWYASGETYEPNVLCYAESKDGVNWEKSSLNPIFTRGARDAWDKDRVGGCEVHQLADGRFVMFYIGYSDIKTARIGAAISPDGIRAWKRLKDNPLVEPTPGEWDSAACYKPSAVWDGESGRWMIWYNGRTGSREYVGLAIHDGYDLDFDPKSGATKPLKVLMIGNSFSVCVLKELPKCAAAAGKTLDIASLYIGGCPLDRHCENIDKAGASDFRPYEFTYSYASVKNSEDAPVAVLGKKTNVPQALVADKWDVVTIQQASHKSLFYETYQPYADRLIAKIHELAPQAEVVIQQTWSYSPYSGRLDEWGLTPETMFAAVKDAYGKLARQHGLRIIPTGEAIQLYRRRLPVDYGKLLAKEERDALRQPKVVDFHGDVVGTSAWRKGEAWEKNNEVVALRTDTIHLNSDGYYLQACVWLAVLFGIDVAKLDYAPASIPPDRAKLMRICAADSVLSVAEARTSPFRAIGEDKVRGYMERFSFDDEELYPHDIRNRCASSWAFANVPRFECPDIDIERTYYFRWWTYRKHLRKMSDGWVVTEFLPDVPWAGKNNTISCPLNHHLMEGRWLRDKMYLDDYLRFMAREGTIKGPRAYACAPAWCAMERAKVTGDGGTVAELLPDFVRNYEAWERGWMLKKGTFATGFKPERGLFDLTGDREGTECALSPDGARPMVNSMMWAEAKAISQLAREAGDNVLATRFSDKAVALEKAVKGSLWNVEKHFFTTLSTDGNLDGVCELHGYAPFYFRMPLEGFGEAWRPLLSESGFFAPKGLTFPTRDTPGFNAEPDFGNHECLWDGPSWPYATSVALTALYEILQSGAEIPVDKADFARLLKQYAAQQVREREDGKTVPWIDENLNPFTGNWQARTILIEQARRAGHEPRFRERGKDYNHSTFCDLVIAGLCGLVPQPDGSLVVKPLAPDEWDWWCIDGVRYHGRDITILFDRDGTHYGKGKGLIVLE